MNIVTGNVLDNNLTETQIRDIKNLKSRIKNEGRSSVVVLLEQLQGSAVRIPINWRPARVSFDIKSFSKQLVDYYWLD